MRIMLFVVGTIFMASSVMAHDEVKNIAVKARMQAMQGMAKNMKALGKIARGKERFNKSEAEAIVRRIADLAAQAPALFREKEMDPQSKAKPEIWFNYSDFVARAGRLEEVSLNLSETIANSKNAGLVLREIGQACKSCHGAYKQ